MYLTLRSRILFYFLVVSLSGILISSISILWGFEDHFKDYLGKNRTKYISLIKEEAVRAYEETGNLVSVQLMSIMHEQAMTENLFYVMYDTNGEILIDTTTMLRMMEGMGMMDEGKQDYKLSTRDLKINDTEIGTIKVYYPNSLIGEDFTFLKNIKQNIYLGAIVTLVLSIVFSMLFSKRLTIGFNKFSKAVKALQEHKWNTPVSTEGLTNEMKPLAKSLNALAETLSKEEILRKQFTADLAHELRTPLATLRSQIEAYQDGIWEPTPIRLQQSHDELMRLVRLVNELEKLLAAENPKINLQKTKIEAGRMLAIMESQFIPVSKEKGVNLQLVKSDSEHWFKADRDKVIQVLSNIINNAIQYTPTGKSIFLSVVESDKFIGFSIKDEGIGINKGDLPFLYERFYRGDKSRNRKTGGIGIGLSIVKALVDAHEGEIEIKSEINVGTVVTVNFPKN